MRRLSDIDIRVDRIIPENELVSRFLDNGLPLFTTDTKATDDLDNLILGEDATTVTTAHGDPMQNLFGCGDGLKPDAKIAIGALNFESALKHEAEAQLMRAFKLGEEENKKSDHFLANWPVWLDAQRSQHNALNHLQQLQSVLQSVNETQSLTDLNYPTTTPLPEIHRPLYKVFDSISTSTQSQEFENVSLSLMRRLAGVYQVKKDLALCKEGLAVAPEQQSFFQDLLIDLLGQWNCYSQLHNSMSETIASEEIDLKIAAEMWVEVLSVPSSVWGIDEEVKKGILVMNDIRDARIRDETMFEDEDTSQSGGKQVAGNQAHSLLSNYMNGAEMGNVIAPSGSWPSLPMISPFTTLFSVVKLKPKEPTSTSPQKYTVQVDLKGDLGMWITKEYHLQVRLRPVSLKPLMTSNEVEVECRCCGAELSPDRAVWNTVATTKQTRLCPKEASKFSFDISEKPKEVDERSEERKKLVKSIDNVLRRARLIGIHRAIFLISQIQSSVYLSKAPTKQGEGGLLSASHGRALESKGKKALAIYSMACRSPISGTKFMTDGGPRSDHPAPWLYKPLGMDAPPDASVYCHQSQNLLDDIVLRTEYDLIRATIPSHMPISYDHLDEAKRSSFVTPSLEEDVVYHATPSLLSWDSNSTRLRYDDCPLFMSIDQNTRRVSGYRGDVEITVSLDKHCDDSFIERSVPGDLCSSCQKSWIKQWHTLEVLATHRLVQVFCEKWTDGVIGVNEYWKASQIETDLVVAENDDYPVEWDKQKNIRSGRHFFESWLTWLSKLMVTGGPVITVK